MRVIKDGKPYRYYWKHEGDPPRRRKIAAPGVHKRTRGPRMALAWPERGGVRGKPGEVPSPGIVGDWKRSISRAVSRLQDTW